MGNPKKHRKKYSKPSHPWDKLRIDSEKILMKDYGLGNKKELWKMESILKNFKKQAKMIIASFGEEKEQEKIQVTKRLEQLGLLQKGQEFGEVLAVELPTLLDKRLQTRVFKKGLARTISQARQFIVHEHIRVGDKIINAPSYLVNVSEDKLISFVEKSSISKDDHPERVVIQEAKDLKKEIEELKKKDEELIAKKPVKKENPKKEVKSTKTVKKTIKPEKEKKEVKK